jgi:hypothetical protein
MPRSPRQGYEVYDGNGEVNGVVSTSVEGETSRNQPSSQVWEERSP